MEQMSRQIVFDYIKKKYGVQPNFPWRRDRTSAVFRHTDNKKWFALMMTVDGEKVGLPAGDPVDVINLKMDDMFYRDLLIREGGIIPAYHMNRMHWITVFLNGRMPAERIFELIDISFMATASAKKREKLRPPKEWIIPSNPKFYDVIRAFDEADLIDWKQGAGIRKGDTVFLYVGEPVSAILYQCLVTETDIPYHFQDKNLTITALMKISLQKRFRPDRFTFEVLKREYGINAVRGPRGIPYSLSVALKEEPNSEKAHISHES